MIHTVKGFGIVNKAEIDVFLELSCFFDNPAAAAAKSLQSCPTLVDPIDCSPPGFPSLGFSRQEYWYGLPFPSPVMYEVSEVKSFSHVQLFETPMDCCLPGSSAHGIFQSRVLEWGAISFCTVKKI